MNEPETPPISDSVQSFIETPDFRCLFDSAPDHYLVLSPTLRIVAASNAYLAATMTQRENVLGRGLFEVFPDNPNDLDATGVRNLTASLQRVIQNGVKDSMDIQKYDIRRPESEGGGFEERYWSPTNSPVFGPDGKLIYIIHRVEDVTDVVRLTKRNKEQEIAVEKLREHGEQMEESFRLLVEDTKDYGIFMLDPHGKIITWNRGAERIKGYRAEEIIGQHFSCFYTDEDLQQGKPAHVLEKAATDGRFEDEGYRLRKDGTKFWANVVISVMRDDTGQLRGFSKITRDISERKYAEQNALRLLQEEAARRAAEEQAEIVWRQREHLRVTLQSIGDGVIATDAEGRVSFLNPVAQKLTGWYEDAIGLPMESVFRIQHETTRQLLPNPVLRCLTEGRTIGLGNHSILVSKEGIERSIADSAAPIRDERGDIIGVVLVFRDVTEQKEAESQVRLLGMAIEAVSQGIVITDPNLPDNPVIFCSSGFQRMTGYGKDEVLGKNCRFLQGKETSAESIEALRVATRAGNGSSAEILNYRKDGTKFWNALNVAPIRDDHQQLTHFVGILADVTERRKLEQALNQSKKMEAIGQLAGGIAHDFNNLLTVISGYTELILLKMPPSDPERESVHAIIEAGNRAAELTRQLLAFSRQTVLEPKIVNLNIIVHDTEKLLRRLIGEDIQLTVVLDPLIGRIKVDPGQLGQVLMNLAVNARDAMPKGGKLTVQTLSVELDRAYVNVHADARPGRYAMLAITDTGIGMTPDVTARIFEPFFTTKDINKGTGLGLAVVHGIIKQSGGFVEVYSELDCGTCFKIYLPIVDDNATQPKAPASSTKLVGSETILFVEDEDGVRKLGSALLKSYGYHVMTASNGLEAIRVADQFAGPIDLLLTDVVMPGMGGRDLAEVLGAKYPQMKKLFSSGYTNDAVVRHGLSQDIVAFLQKPYDPITLVGKVRQVLDRD